MASKIYNFGTYFWHKVLRAPIKLKKGLERKVRKPQFTVVCLHGIAANSDTWKSTFRTLSASPLLKDTRLISLDLLGFGKSLKSDWLEYNYNDYLSAISNSIKSYHIKTPIILIGHSMGSLIAAEFARKNPKIVRQLILVSPPVLMPEEVAKLPDKFYLKTYSSLHKITDKTVIKALAGFIQKVTSFRKDQLRSTAFTCSMDKIILNPYNYKTYTHLKVPTCIIHGRIDPLVRGANLTKAAKDNSNYVKMINVSAAHDISANKRAKILDIIEKVIKDETL